MRFAGPIAGAFSIHKVFQNYVESVSWVAKVTGGYFEKLENYKYKMAMLARVTREDIEVYRKYREALVKFNITMGDLSMKIMREFYPVFRTMIDGLNKFSDWVDRNHDNIIRFLEVAAGVIATGGGRSNSDSAHAGNHPHDRGPIGQSAHVVYSHAGHDHPST